MTARGATNSVTEAQLQRPRLQPRRVCTCHGQRRWVALAVGFPAHQPVALGHAMAPS